MTRGTYKTNVIPGSWRDLIEQFRKHSPKYRSWSPGTKRTADRVFDDWRTEHGQKQVSTLTLGQIVRLRDSISETPGAANNWVKFMRHLLSYARRIEMIAVNPLAGGALESLPPSHPGGFRTWREDEAAAYREFHPLGTTARLAFELAAGTGATPVDLVKLGPLNVSDGRIRYRRQKTERRKGAEETPLVNLRILPELAEALEMVPPGQSTFLETEWGYPRSQGALAHQFRRWVKLAGLGEGDRYGRHLTLHGLRKALGTRLAERGASPHIIMSYLGHESIKSATVYTKAYDREKAADMGAELLADAPKTNVTRIKPKKEPKE